MEDNKTGTDEPGCSGWYYVDAEAECSDTGDDFEELIQDENDLIDDSPQAQGDSLQLMHELDTQTDDLQLAALKRKYLNSPLSRDIEDLSPRLDKVNITPRKTKKAKKVLFNDSGVASESFVDSAASASPPDASPEGEAAEDEGGAAAAPTVAQSSAAKDVENLLKSSNIRATLHFKFKEIVGVSFSELTRKYTSTRTMSVKWCIAIFGIPEPFFQTVKPLLSEHCDYMCLTHYAHELGSFLLALVEFKAQKCKDTIHKLLKTLMLVQPEQMMIDPPRTRSPATALFWYKKSVGDPQNTLGDIPEWIAAQVLVGHQFAAEKPFELSAMIQWAYDNELDTECMIAKGYADLAAEDPNAKAFLSSNHQAKIVKDCTTMVRLYRRAEMRQCSMSAWIHRRCTSVTPGEDADWKNIVSFLRYQRIEFINFLGSFKRFLKGEPKKSCIALWGNPDSGKSTFAMTLIKFLKGRVVSYANSCSQFWLSPLIDAKVGLVDDVTDPCLHYFDTYLRGALDGNLVCLDSKHRNPIQIKMPPMLLTTNVDIKSNPGYRFLHSRIDCYEMSQPFPFQEDGTPVYKLNDQSWHSFFKRFWTPLELSDQEDGETHSTLRISSRRSAESV